jgi:hypothetical protein
MKPLLTAALLAVRLIVDHNAGAQATRAFRFEHVAPPAKDDAAAHATVTLIAGTLDRGSAELSALTDGATPTMQDEPGANVFFKPDSWGGRIRLDLGSVIDVAAVNTYSWHPDSRAPQVYYLYASDGAAPGFNPAPDTKTDPVTCGWKRIAFVDTRPKEALDGSQRGPRPKEGDAGGQYAVSITDTDGLLGRYRYLLFDVFETESEDVWGNTFYSEIDVIAGSAR